MAHQAPDVPPSRRDSDQSGNTDSTPKSRLTQRPASSRSMPSASAPATRYTCNGPYWKAPSSMWAIQ